MNSVSILDLILLALAVGAIAWAVFERLRSERWKAKAEFGQTGAQAVKEQAALTANSVADELIKRASDTFEAQIKPLSSKLAEFEATVAAAEKARAEDSGGLKTQIRHLLEASSATQEEARKLSTALRRGTGVQGRWGEQVLRNVLELAGMKAQRDFQEQLQADTGGLRPDVTVRLAGGAVFVIDAKCSLSAYLEAQEATDDIARAAAYQRHAASVKTHMQSLSNKAYWDQFDAAPEFVAMFIPGDAFLAAAQDHIPDLHIQAMNQKVILVTPSSLFALCKAVIYGWRAQEQQVNARKIAELGRELYKRISVMGSHVASVGKSLESTVAHFNKFVGSLETQVLVQARRFEDLSADHPAAPVAELPVIEGTVRPVTRLAIETSDPAPVLTLGGAAHTSAP